MSDTNKELAVLLAEACNQLPLAASCWNQDDDRELADRNVQHVLGLINRINEALATPHPETPSIDGAEVWERVQRVLSMPNAKKKTGEQLGEAIALSLGLTQTPAPLRGEESAMWLPSMRDQGVQAPSHNGPRGEWYQHGYSWGWNDCLRRIQEERQSLAAPMPQSAVVTDEQISEWALRMFEMDAIDIEIELRRILALAPGLSGWQEIASAPKDSKARLVWEPRDKNIFCVTWSDGYGDEPKPGWYIFGVGGWNTSPIAAPTHWMPLPAAPGIAPHQAKPEGKPWDMKTAHEKAPELIAQLDEESERLTRYGGSGDALLNEAARVIEALTQTQPDPKEATECPHADEPRGCYRVRCQLGRKCAGDDL